MNTLFHFIRDSHILALVDVAVAREATSLNLSHSQLSEVPSNMGDCIVLTKLMLHCNSIKKVKTNIILQNLRYQIDFDLQLPEFCVRLVNLTTLTLDYNSLDHFPAVLCDIRSLTNLNVSCNELQHIPAEIGKLTNLQVQRDSERERNELGFRCHLFTLICRRYFGATTHRSASCRKKSVDAINCTRWALGAIKSGSCPKALPRWSI